MTTDRKTSILLLAFCAVMAVLTTQLPNATMEGAPGPQFFPAILIGGLTIASLFLLLRKPREEEQEKEPLSKAFRVFGLICLYFALVPLLGFLLGTLIGIFIFLKQSIKSTWNCLFTALGSAVGLYLIFDVLLKIPLPSGIFF